MYNEMVRTLAAVCLLATFAWSSVSAEETSQLGSPYIGLANDHQQSTRFGWIPEATNEHSVIEDTAPRGYLPDAGTEDAERRESLRRAYTGQFGKEPNPYSAFATCLQEAREDGEECLIEDCEFPKRIHEKGDCHKNFCIMISASWCGPCKKMYPLILELRDEGYIVYVFDITRDEFKNYDAKFDVRSVPTFIIFEGGKEVTRTVGKTDKKWFTTRLKTRKDQSAELDENPYEGI